MGIRLNKVLTELNIGLQTAVDFLRNKKSLGEIAEDANLSTKISDEQYNALVSQFKGDKDIKNEAEKLAKKGKERKAEKKISNTKADDLVKKVQKYTPLGKIDLDSIGKPAKASSDAIETKPEIKTTAESLNKGNPTERNEVDKSQQININKQNNDNTANNEKNAPKASDSNSTEKADNIDNVKKAETEMTTDNNNITLPETKQKAIESNENVKSEKINQNGKDAMQNDMGNSQSNQKNTKVDNNSNQNSNQNRQNGKSAASIDNSQNKQTQEARNDNKIFTLRSEKKLAPKVNVLGKIDLDALNQSTRPKKKTKEERRKEREEKAMHNGERKKRVRINN